MSPTVFIDADACPVTREAITLARKYHAPIMLVANATQNLARYAEKPGVECVGVSGGRDAADFAIIERLSPGDIVVTQDLGVAAMALGRGAMTMSSRGRVHSAATIDMELEFRHAEQKHRRAGGRTQGPSRFEEEDREHFVEVLERLLRDGPPQRG